MGGKIGMTGSDIESPFVGFPLSTYELSYGYARALDSGDDALLTAQEYAFAQRDPSLLDSGLQELLNIEIDELDAQGLLRAIDIAKLAEGTEHEVFFDACMSDIFSNRPDLVPEVLLLAPELATFFENRRKTAIKKATEVVALHADGKYTAKVAIEILDSIARGCTYDLVLVEAIRIVIDGSLIDAPLEVTQSK